MAKLNKVSGKLSKNFPPKANKIAIELLNQKKLIFSNFLIFSLIVYLLLILEENKQFLK